MKLTKQLKTFTDKINQQRSKTEIEESLELINNYGAVFKEEMFIRESNLIIPIKLNKITKILFIKRRKYHWNLACFSLSILLGIMIIKNEKLMPFLKTIELIASLLAIIGIYFKTFQYKLVIIVQKYDFIEYMVHKKYKEAAKEIVNHVARRIASV